MAFFPDLLSPLVLPPMNYGASAMLCAFQVPQPLGPGRRRVRQLVHVNGVDADELTLAEVRVIFYLNR